MTVKNQKEELITKLGILIHINIKISKYKMSRRNSLKSHSKIP